MAHPEDRRRGIRSRSTSMPRPSDRATSGDTPVVAILIGGLGVDAGQEPRDAIAGCPAVTLAFTPYGNAIAAGPRRAPAPSGHEIFLQIPMEPFDSPTTIRDRRHC